MSGIEALFLGLLQGLTEFLPISSSGHLEIGNYFLKTSASENLTFTVTVHTATVLSTIVVFREDLRNLILQGMKFRMNKETSYMLKLLLSAIPVALIGFFLREETENLFTGNMLLVGSCLLVTAALLAFASFKKVSKHKEISWPHSLIIGVAQAIAVLPGLSRSGLTIATGLLLGNEKKEAARFSFLMVILPILGVSFLDIIKSGFSMEAGRDTIPLVIGFLAAFLSGLLACRWMITIVSKGKLIYFAVYCLIIGLIAIFAA